MGSSASTGRRSRRAICAAALQCLLLATAPAATAEAARDPFFVPVVASQTGFGPFTEALGKNGAAARLEGAFGPPSATERTPAACTLDWQALGISALLTNYGQEIEPCSKGYFVSARLTDKRWHTAARVHPGSSESAARRVSTGRCSRSRCGAAGYILGRHPSDCAGRKVPSVVAEVRNGRVAALRVLTHGCE